MKRRNFISCLIAGALGLLSNIAYAINPRKRTVPYVQASSVHNIVSNTGNDVVFSKNGIGVIPVRTNFRRFASKAAIEQLASKCPHVYMVDYKDGTFSVLGSYQELEHSEKV